MGCLWFTFGKQPGAVGGCRRVADGLKCPLHTVLPARTTKLSWGYVSGHITTARGGGGLLTTLGS